MDANTSLHHLAKLFELVSIGSPFIHHHIGGHEHILAHSLHEVTSDLEHQMTHRIDENALREDKI